MSMYLFNIFNESEDNNNITTILICLDTNPLFLLIFKKSQNLLHALKLSPRSISHKRLKIFIFIFFNFSSSSFQNIFHYKTFHSTVAFQRYQVYEILLHVQKVKMARKISTMHKKSYFSYIAFACIIQVIIITKYNFSFLTPWICFVKK